MVRPILTIRQSCDNSMFGLGALRFQQRAASNGWFNRAWLVDGQEVYVRYLFKNRRFFSADTHSKLLFTYLLIQMSFILLSWVYPSDWWRSYLAVEAHDLAITSESHGSQRRLPIQTSHSTQSRSRVPSIVDSVSGMHCAGFEAHVTTGQRWTKLSSI